MLHKYYAEGKLNIITDEYHVDMLKSAGIEVLPLKTEDLESVNQLVSLVETYLKLNKLHQKVGIATYFGHLFSNCYDSVVAKAMLLQIINDVGISLDFGSYYNEVKNND